jgi:LacI family transcriptional regulator
MKTGRKSPVAAGTVTLKTVAEKVGLSPGTVSAVLNQSPSAVHIPQATRERIVAAAAGLNYRPNYFARSLRRKRTNTLGVIANEIGDAYGSLIISGIESYARQKDYFFITGIHRHDPQLFDRYSRLLLERGVEGFITIDLNLPRVLPLPTVAVSGHGQLRGVTNIVIDHSRAAALALQHLLSLGHRDIAFMRGDPASSDSSHRWQAIHEVGRDLGIVFRPELIVQIESRDSSPELGYPFAKRLLARKSHFTALFAFNDVSAIGAMRAFQEAGFKVPADISVVGFDDIEGAAFHYPSLTTIRQPLRKMGEIAAATLLEKIQVAPNGNAAPAEIAVAPQLIIRESTAPRR